jgi:phosphate transport system protein
MWKDIINYLKQDDLYTQALHECHAMLDLDLEMFKRSVEALRVGGGDGSFDFVATDKKINEFERDVRRKILSHLALTRAADLSAGLALVSIVVDIERIGDYSKNIHAMAVVHQGLLRGGSVEADVADIERTVDRLFSQSVLAFKANDAEAARVVMSSYREDLAVRCDNLVDSVIGGKVCDLSPSDAASIALYVRYLKRITAHSRNVMTSIVNPFHRIGYKEKGEGV